MLCAGVRPHALLCALVVTVVVAAGCRVPVAGPHEALLPLWREYEKLPPHRAMAIAGDPDRPAWVGAIAGGAYEQAVADEMALERCRQKRKQRRMRAPCLLYAKGDEIVWLR